MDIQQHRQEFERIAEKYGLKNEKKADEIAEFLTTHKSGPLSVAEFAKLFAMEEEDARIFLTFIDRGLRFKEQHIDPHHRQDNP